MAALVIRKAEPINTNVMILRALGLPEESGKRMKGGRLEMYFTYIWITIETLTFFVGHNTNALLMITACLIVKFALTDRVSAFHILRILFNKTLCGFAAGFAQYCQGRRIIFNLYRYYILQRTLTAFGFTDSVFLVLLIRASAFAFRGAAGEKGLTLLILNTLIVQLLSYIGR